MTVEQMLALDLAVELKVIGAKEGDIVILSHYDNGMLASVTIATDEEIARPWANTYRVRAGDLRSY